VVRTVPVIRTYRVSDAAAAKVISSTPPSPVVVENDAGRHVVPSAEVWIEYALPRRTPSSA
jgi:hypothetical protein